MDGRLTSISRTLSYILRHAPEDYGLQLDAQGWASIEDVVAALRQVKRYCDVRVQDIEQTVAQASKQRHEIRGGRIRAIYGHSIDTRIVHEPAEPPAVLYHGTSPAKVGLIMARGILPMRRQYAHLAADTQMAIEVGARHADQPTVLQVDAAAAHTDGVVFYRGSDRIWLADAVPGEYLSIWQ